MRWICVCFAAVAALGRLAVAQDHLSPAIANVPHCVVALAEQADLPPQEAGVIKEIAVKEGDKVDVNQLLLQLDDSKAQQEQKVAEAKHAAAMAKFKAADINVEYAIAAKAVADQEFRVNQKANTDVPGSVPQVRLSELSLKCEETKLAIEKAKSDKEIADEEAKVAAAEVEAAKLMVQRHKIVSPIAGEVVELRAHKGEAVQPAQAVIRVVNLDRLWVEGNVPAGRFARSELAGRPVTIDVVITRGEKISLPGEVIFVKPLTDPGESYMVRAKVENRKENNGSWQLYPGMQADMNIQLK